MMPIERPSFDGYDRYLIHRMSPEDAAREVERHQREAWAHFDGLSYKDVDHAYPQDGEPVATHEITLTQSWRAEALEAMRYRIAWLKAATPCRYADCKPWPDFMIATGAQTEWDIQLPFASDGTWDVRISDSGTLVSWFGHYEKPADWAYRQKFPVLKLDIKGYVVEADGGFLRRRLGMGSGKSALARFATSVAEDLQRHCERRMHQLDHIGEARVRREARAIAKAMKTLEGKAKTVTLPNWLYREIERYRMRNQEGVEPMVLAKGIGEVTAVVLGQGNLGLFTASGQTVHIEGEAELVDDEFIDAIWPRPDDWGMVAGLRGRVITEAYREASGAVILEIETGSYIKVSNFNHCRVLPA